jgi:hypothetical protein
MNLMNYCNAIQKEVVGLDTLMMYRWDSFYATHNKLA